MMRSAIIKIKAANTNSSMSIFFFTCRFVMIKPNISYFSIFENPKMGVIMY